MAGHPIADALKCGELASFLNIPRGPLLARRDRTAVRPESGHRPGIWLRSSTSPEAHPRSRCDRTAVRPESGHRPGIWLRSSDVPGTHPRLSLRQDRRSTRIRPSAGELASFLQCPRDPPAAPCDRTAARPESGHRPGIWLRSSNVPGTHPRLRAIEPPFDPNPAAGRRFGFVPPMSPIPPGTC